jgi:hypothetical protein
MKTLEDYHNALPYRKTNDDKFSNIIVKMMEAYGLKDKLMEFRIKKFWKEEMGPQINNYTKTIYSNNRKVFIQYADKYSGVSNYHKKWAGEARGLTKANAVERKVALEQEFAKRIKDNAQYKAYQGILDGFNEQYTKLDRIQPELDLFTEGILSIEILRFAIGFKDLIQAANEPDSEKWKNQLKAQSERVAEFFKDYHLPIDRETMIEMLEAY